jgi:two-component system NtrC family sensor kinase
MPAFGLKDLGTKIVVTALGFSLIPLIVLGVTMYSMFASTYHSKVQANLATLAENKRQGIDLFLREQIAQLRIIANSHSVEALSSPDMLENILNTMQMSSKTFIDLGLIDEEGVHVSYSGPYNLSQAITGTRSGSTRSWCARFTSRTCSRASVAFRTDPSRDQAGEGQDLDPAGDHRFGHLSILWCVAAGRRPRRRLLVNRAGELQTRPRFGNKIMRYSPPVRTPFSGAGHGHEMYNKKFFVGGIWLEQKD